MATLAFNELIKPNQHISGQYPHSYKMRTLTRNELSVKQNNRTPI